MPSICRLPGKESFWVCSFPCSSRRCLCCKYASSNPSCCSVMRTIQVYRGLIGYGGYLVLRVWRGCWLLQFGRQVRSRSVHTFLAASLLRALFFTSPPP